jgi:hypothetical protein
MNYFPRTAKITGLGHVLPHHRGKASGAVAEQELQIFTPVAASSELDLAYEKRLRYVNPIFKFPDFHRLAKIEWRADAN